MAKALIELKRMTGFLTIFQLFHEGQFYWWGKQGVFSENENQ
jgi:hypothetical protein